MNERSTGAGRVSNLTDEARARGAASTRVKSLVSMEAVQGYLAIIGYVLDGVEWAKLSLRAKAELLNKSEACSPHGLRFGAMQVKRLEAKARDIVNALEGGYLTAERLGELSNAPSDDIRGLVAAYQILGSAVQYYGE